MSARILTRFVLFVVVAALSLTQSPRLCGAGEILIADRQTNSVFRYSDSGAYLGTLVTSSALNQPSGIAVSPDLKELYVSSLGSSDVIRYDYNYAAGTVSNPTVFADSSSGLSSPNSIIFSPTGDKIYVSNLGGTGVDQFNLDGSSAGPAINGVIAGGSIFQFSGMAYSPTGQLLVGGFQDFPGGTQGSVAVSNAAISSISDFIPESTTLNGAAGLLVHNNDLYVSGLFSGVISKYNATTGAIDNSFSLSGLSFPQGIIAAPDGNGMLVGILGLGAGIGNITRYSYDGTPLGIFAASQPLPPIGVAPTGFSEATALVAVPEPASIGLLGMALTILGFVARRRAARQR